MLGLYGWAVPVLSTLNEGTARRFDVRAKVPDASCWTIALNTVVNGSMYKWRAPLRGEQPLNQVSQKGLIILEEGSINRTVIGSVDEREEVYIFISKVLLVGNTQIAIRWPVPGSVSLDSEVKGDTDPDHLMDWWCVTKDLPETITQSLILEVINVAAAEGSVEEAARLIPSAFHEDEFDVFVSGVGGKLVQLGSRRANPGDQCKELESGGVFLGVLIELGERIHSSRWEVGAFGVNTRPQIEGFNQCSHRRVSFTHPLKECGLTCRNLSRRCREEWGPGRVNHSGRLWFVDYSPHTGGVDHAQRTRGPAQGVQVHQTQTTTVRRGFGLGGRGSRRSGSHLQLVWAESRWGPTLCHPSRGIPGWGRHCGTPALGGLLVTGRIRYSTGSIRR